MYSREPTAHVFASGEAHLKTISIMETVLKCCMLPSQKYRTVLTVVEDGSEDEVKLPYSTALEVASGPQVHKSERVRCIRRGSASIVLALLVGEARVRISSLDRIIVFSFDENLRAEISSAETEVVNPDHLEAHYRWWRERELSLIIPQIQVITPADRAPSEEEATPPQPMPEEVTSPEPVPSPSVPDSPENDTAVLQSESPAVPDPPTCLLVDAADSPLIMLDETAPSENDPFATLDVFRFTQSGGNDDSAPAKKNAPRVSRARVRVGRFMR